MAVNPFPEGKKLIEMVHSLRVHFQYSNQFDAMIELFGNVRGADVPSRVPQSRIQMDYNTTRVNASNGLIVSILRLHLPLKLFLELKKGS